MSGVREGTADFLKAQTEDREWGTVAIGANVLEVSRKGLARISALPPRGLSNGRNQGARLCIGATFAFSLHRLRNNSKNKPKLFRTEKGSHPEPHSDDRGAEPGAEAPEGSQTPDGLP